ncbi:hypothetical protein Q5752_003030 [Cryptotrichosporon argae]
MSTLKRARSPSPALEATGTATPTALGAQMAAPRSFCRPPRQRARVVSPRHHAPCAPVLRPSLRMYRSTPAADASETETGYEPYAPKSGGGSGSESDDREQLSDVEDRIGAVEAIVRAPASRSGLIHKHKQKQAPNGTARSGLGKRKRHDEHYMAVDGDTTETDTENSTSRLSSDVGGMVAHTPIDVSDTDSSEDHEAVRASLVVPAQRSHEQTPSSRLAPRAAPDSPEIVDGDIDMLSASASEAATAGAAGPSTQQHSAKRARMLRRGRDRDALAPAHRRHFDKMALTAAGSAAAPFSYHGLPGAQSEAARRGLEIFSAISGWDVDDFAASTKGKGKCKGRSRSAPVDAHDDDDIDAVHLALAPFSPTAALALADSCPPRRDRYLRTPLRSRAADTQHLRRASPSSLLPRREVVRARPSARTRRSHAARTHSAHHVASRARLAPAHVDIGPIVPGHVFATRLRAKLAQRRRRRDLVRVHRARDDGRWARAVGTWWGCAEVRAGFAGLWWLTDEGEVEDLFPVRPADGAQGDEDAVEQEVLAPLPVIGKRPRTADHSTAEASDRWARRNALRIAELGERDQRIRAEHERAQAAQREAERIASAAEARAREEAEAAAALALIEEAAAAEAAEAAAAEAAASAAATAVVAVASPPAYELPFYPVVERRAARPVPHRRAASPMSSAVSVDSPPPRYRRRAGMYSSRSPSPPPPYNAATDCQTVIAPVFRADPEAAASPAGTRSAVRTPAGPRQATLVGAFPVAQARTPFEAALDMEEGDAIDQAIWDAEHPAQADGLLARVLGWWRQ